MLEHVRTFIITNENLFSQITVNSNLTAVNSFLASISITYLVISKDCILAAKLSKMLPISAIYKIAGGKD